MTAAAPVMSETVQPATLHLSGAMLTDVGRVRTHNEDSVTFVVPSERGGTPQGDSFLLVADGMGGHAAGDVASALAAEVVRRVFFELKGSVPSLLSTAFAAANRAILGYSQEHPECAGMGTTCTAVAVRDGLAWLAHVGDSRAYLLRGAKLTQLSEDQTLVRQLVKDGTLTEEEAKHNENNNVLLQALGTLPEVQPELSSEGIGLAPDDVLVLCTDGLHGLVDDARIADIAGRLAPLEACQQLIQEALQAGGHDNVSVGVFRAVSAGLHPAADAPQQRTTRRIPSIGNTSDSGPAGQTTRLVSSVEGPL